MIFLLPALLLADDDACRDSFTKYLESAVYRVPPEYELNDELVDCYFRRYREWRNDKHQQCEENHCGRYVGGGCDHLMSNRHPLKDEGVNMMNACIDELGLDEQ